MSNFTTVDIPLQTIVLASEPLPKSLIKVVSNQGILETYLETLYNTFEINSTNKAIGEYTPINSMNSKKFINYGTDGNGDPDTNNGIYIMQNLENVTNQGYFRPFDNGGAFGTEIKTDKITISTEINFGATAAMVFPDDVTLTNVTITGNASFAGGMNDSIEYVNVTLEETTQANNTLSITSSTSRVIVLNVKMAADIYSGGWALSGNVSLTLVNSGMVDGQEVDIIVGSIVDSGESAIANNTNGGYFYISAGGTFTNGLKPDSTTSSNNFLEYNTNSFVAYPIWRRYKLINSTLVQL